jgi:hypothetical protein
VNVLVACILLPAPVGNSVVLSANIPQSSCFAQWQLLFSLFQYVFNICREAFVLAVFAIHIQQCQDLGEQGTSIRCAKHHLLKGYRPIFHFIKISSASRQPASVGTNDSNVPTTMILTPGYCLTVRTRKQAPRCQKEENFAIG